MARMKKLLGRLEEAYAPSLRRSEASDNAATLVASVKQAMDALDNLYNDLSAGIIGMPEQTMDDVKWWEEAIRANMRHLRSVADLASKYKVALKRKAWP